MIKYFLLLLVATSAFAEDVKCVVVSGKDFLPEAKIILSTDTGNARLINSSQEFFLINETYVSRFRADRNKCAAGKNTLIGSEKNILAVWQHFNDCVHQQNNQIGYVSAKWGFDLRSGNGYYAEIFATASGPVPTADLELKECQLLLY